MRRIGLSNSSIALRTTTVAVVIASLLNLGAPRAGASVQGPSLKTETQVRREAGLYDTAIREISRIETIRFATGDDSKSARDILERQTRNLRFIRSKLMAIGLGESTFVNSAKARTRDNITPIATPIELESCEI